MNKIKALILDLDDTLLIEEETACYCLGKTIEEFTAWDEKKAFDSVGHLRLCAKKRWYGLSTHKRAQELHISSWEALWADFDPSEPFSKVFVPIQKEYQLGVWKDFFCDIGLSSIELAERAMVYNKNLRKNRHILFSDTLEFLENVNSQLTMGLITNGAAETQKCKLNGSGLARYFQVILIAGELGYGKPDPRIYQQLCQELEQSAENCLMIGNSLTNDVLGAIEAGMKAIWLNRGEQSDQSKNDLNYWICKSLGEAWNIIKPLI